MSLLLKDGRLIDPATGRDGRWDVLISDGKVVSVEQEISPSDGDQVLDVSGCYVVPGLIDLHVHLREPGFEYKETIHTGTLAAAHGGYTSVCAMPNTKPVIDSPDLVRWLKEKCHTEAVVNVWPIGAMTKGQKGQELADIAGMAEAGAVAVSEDGKSVMDACLCREGMRQAALSGIPFLDHCEDKGLAGKGALNEGPTARRLGVEGIGNETENVIAARDILLAQATGCHLHLCHCSTKESVWMVQQAKAQGLPITAEACPHHLLLTQEDILTDDANFKMNPPLRAKEDRDVLVEGLRKGIVDVVSTDHAPHALEEKSVGIAKAPFGIVGSETALPLLMTELVHTGKMTPYELVERMSFRPAQIIGIDRGSLAEGKVADITVIDPEKEDIIHASQFRSKGKNTPFEGWKVRGKAIYTIVGGQIVYEEEK